MRDMLDELDALKKAKQSIERGDHIETIKEEDSAIWKISASISQIQNDMRQESAEKKAEKSKDRNFQLINTLLGAVVGSLVTLLVEHFPQIIRFLCSLFH